MEKRYLNENLLKSNLPSDITYALYQNRTSLGNNPAIPDIYGVPFLYHIVNNEFENAKKKLQEIGSVNEVEGNTIKDALSQLIALCQEKEKPYRNQLEKICFDHAIDMFGIPSDSVVMDVQLKDKVEIDAQVVKISPADDSEDMVFDNLNDARRIRKEVYKRRLLDVLSFGAGISISSNIKNYYKDISMVDPTLPDLYNKIMVMNTYLLFEKEDLGISDKNNRQIGTVEVFLGKKDEKVKIAAQGVIFPILLCETIRGFMELFISHGLPKDFETARAILEKSDYLKAEPWDMRMGPALWDLFEASANDISLEEMPYLFKRVASLDVKKFNFLMKEIFAKTKKGKEIMAHISAKAKRDMEYDEFLDKMDKKNKDKGIITDEYILAEEL